MLCFWIAGLVFTFLIYALVAAFANLGKAVAVLLLIIQVTGCGGSFPLQLLPPFVQALSPWLPATHVVNAMRAAMFGTYGADFWTEIGLLLLFLIPAALIGLVLRKPLAKFMTWYVEQVESSARRVGLRLVKARRHALGLAFLWHNRAEKREGNRRRVARSTTSGWSPVSTSEHSPRS
ncbi:MAG: ABC transporter permease [Eggerthellaceae bacterium]